FLGSALGSGKQYISWIHIHDLSRIIAAAVQKNEIKGIYNAVSPDTVTNLQMIQVLAQCLNRPVILPPVPSFLLKILLGDMSEIVLDGQMVSSEKIQKEGFEFTYPSLEKALKNILLNGKK
ncbi:MAG: DUF1731 domain-containing protein, partial [Spirochaetia bacterium]|nr:DUF1731 domain-containing protein [Spirochaetia bacterium]